MRSRAVPVAKFVLIDLLGSIVWFPVWWYTKGLMGLMESMLAALRYRAAAFAFRIWIKNFFVPMYGQYDILGRSISVVMRLVVLVGRLFVFLIEALLYLCGLIVWLLLPPVTLLLAVQSGWLGVVRDRLSSVVLLYG